MVQAEAIPTTPAPEPTTHGAMLLTRLTRMAPVPAIPYCHTANSEDVEATRRAIELATDIYVSHVGRLLQSLNENLPVTRTVDASEFLSGLADLKNDLDGELIHAADRQ